MRVFKTKLFAKWAKNVGLDDNLLYNVIAEMEQGLLGASLGGDIYKRRVAFPRRGKRGGVRTLLAFKKNDKAFFIFGFAKNELDNMGVAPPGCRKMR